LLVAVAAAKEITDKVAQAAQAQVVYAAQSRRQVAAEL
jgi:hypothetical protein